MTPITVVQGLIVTATMAVCYVLLGLLLDARRRRRAMQYETMRHDLAAVLFRPGEQAEAAANRLANGSLTVLLDLLQRSAVDLNGEADHRVRVLIRMTGLARRIRRRIRSRSWRRRAQVAALASLLPAQDVDRFTLLTDEHPVVRSRAVEAMEQSDVADHVDGVIAMLDDPNAAVRLAAMNALVHGGAPVVPALEQYLRQGSGGEGGDGGSGERQVEEPAPGLVFALDVAANLPDPRLLPTIEHHAHSPDPGLRAAAARALRPWAASAIGTLLTLLGDEEPTVRATAVSAIGAGEIETLAGDVGRLLQDPSWEVRRAAGLALAALGPTGAMTLRVYTESADPYAQDMARQTLAVLDAASPSLAGAR